MFFQRHRIATRVERSQRYSAVTDFELLQASRRLRSIARERTLQVAEIAEGLELVREAARRAHGTPHFRVQLQAGWALQAGGAVEMETGEGKTLTALLAAYLLALPGDGCHVLTANDYLAERDAEHARDVLERLGLSVDWISQSATPDVRRRAYACDVTFATVTQVGFDLLRDRVGEREGIYPGNSTQRVQRRLATAVIDEADLVMLDEARTPLLLAVAEPIPESQTHHCRWAGDMSNALQRDRDFVLHSQGKAVQLTEEGCRRVLLAPSSSADVPLTAESSYRLVERALEARLVYVRDQDYLVRDDKVAIIGPTTGRVLDGRQWQNGLQPAIEWKEGAQFSPRTRNNGSITIQSLLNLYPRRCGMSGTVWNDRHEMRAIYNMPVTRISPRLPCLRQRWPTRCFHSMDAKLQALAVELQRLQALGRPVLVGTPSIETSERLAAVLRSTGLPHELLTARDPAREAEIVKQAGQPGHVTIATNMAGRGTDIRIAPEVRDTGGLHVIVAGLQASARTDRQLMGRTARQGEPGSYQEFLSFDDELLQQWRPETAERWRRRIRGNRQGELPRWERSRFRRAQRELEQLHSRHRRRLFRERQEIERWARSVGLDPFLEWLDDERAA